MAHSSDHVITIEPQRLSGATFADFGTVIENPAPSLVPSSTIQHLPPDAVQANQGSALKYLNITLMRNYYASAPSNVPGKAVMNMFYCAPRSLLQTQRSAETEGLFPVDILERHPFTTQTFIPLGLSHRERDKTRYLVIVAPSLAPTATDADLPVPPPSTIEGEHPPGRGFPDLSRIKSFVADGSQAVTYGAGIWHAPMAVIGEKPISFVVIQFANGVGIEDCQEVPTWSEGEARILVAVPKGESGRLKL